MQQCCPVPFCGNVQEGVCMFKDAEFINQYCIIIVIWDDISYQIWGVIISQYDLSVVFSWLEKLHSSKVM